MSRELLRIQNLTVEFSGFRAVDKVNLSIEEGELRVIIGPNGAGKTTLMDLITGKTKPTHGRISLAGKDITGLAPNVISSKYKIGRKFQGPNVFDNLTVYDNIEVALTDYNTVGKSFFFRRSTSTRERIMDMLKKIELEDKKDVAATVLSHGERQWLEISMVMIQEPALIILDEPTAGMTQAETYKTGEMIKSMAGMHTIIVVEHDMDFVKQVAQFVTVLHQGQLLAEGSFEEIEKNQEVIEVYLNDDTKEGETCSK